MARQRWGLTATVLALGLATSLAFAQDRTTTDKTDEGNKGAGQSVGSAVDRTVQSVKRGFRETSAAVREQWSHVKTSVHDMGIQARIYGRLHWDKDLNKAEINMEVRKDGEVMLSGSVADAHAKTKAVQLTRDTVGVTLVVDRLTVQANRPATDAAPEPSETKKP